MPETTQQKPINGRIKEGGSLFINMHDKVWASREKTDTYIYNGLEFCFSRRGGKKGGDTLHVYAYHEITQQPHIITPKEAYTVIVLADGTVNFSDVTNSKEFRAAHREALDYFDGSVVVGVHHDYIKFLNIAIQSTKERIALDVAHLKSLESQVDQMATISAKFKPDDIVYFETRTKDYKGRGYIKSCSPMYNSTTKLFDIAYDITYNDNGVTKSVVVLSGSVVAKLGRIEKVEN